MQRRIRSITVTDAGYYSVKITNDYGCTDTAETGIIVFSSMA
ncbi:MAG: hypothetical protein ABFD00_05835 [Chloroherpetonaceae bacterium]